VTGVDLVRGFESLPLRSASPRGCNDRSAARTATPARRHFTRAPGRVIDNLFDAGIDTAFGRSLGRLAQVKAAYDPDNFFRVNHNIAPA
jgi:hypothetical protein